MSVTIDDIQSLINDNINLNSIVINGRSLLAHVLITQHTPAIQLLLDNHADPNHLDNFGATPLYLAVCSENAHLVKLLLQYGADPNSQVCGYTMLHIAVRENFAEAIQLLFEYGIDPHMKGKDNMTGGQFAKFLNKNPQLIELIEEYSYIPIKEPEYD